MADRSNDRSRPDELEHIARRLSAARDEASPLELDQLKRRAMHKASGSRRRSWGQILMPRLATLLTVGLLTAGAGGTFAIASHENGGSSGTKGGAATAQYCDEEGTENENGTDKGCKPGKGCGDKNHEHARDDQCKKNEHGDNNGGNGNGHGH